MAVSTSFLVVLLALFAVALTYAEILDYYQDYTEYEESNHIPELASHRPTEPTPTWNSKRFLRRHSLSSLRPAADVLVQEKWFVQVCSMTM